MDQNGKLLPEGRICWSEAPLEVVIQKPYAIALLPRFVEVIVCLKQFHCSFFVKWVWIDVVSFYRFDLSELLIL